MKKTSQILLVAAAALGIVAFTPKPRLIGLHIAFASLDTVMLGRQVEPTARFVLKPKLGALIGFFAKLLGKIAALNFCVG